MQPAFKKDERSFLLFLGCSVMRVIIIGIRSLSFISFILGMMVDRVFHREYLKIAFHIVWTLPPWLPRWLWFDWLVISLTQQKSAKHHVVYNMIKRKQGCMRGTKETMPLKQIFQVQHVEIGLPHQQSDRVISSPSSPSTSVSPPPTE